jgi:hypothetical protein
VLELVSDLVAARLATVLVANAFDELTSSVFVSLSEFVELLLLALSDASAQFDAEFDAFDTEFVEALDVPNVSVAFFVAAKVVVKPLLDEVFMPAVNEAAPVNEVVLLPEAFVVKSPATAGPVVVGLLAVVPVLPEVLPPLDAVLADVELGGRLQQL